MDTRIQNIYYNLLILSLQRHCRVFVMRMDIHLPKEMFQGVIMDFNHRFIEKEKNAGYGPLYIMVRENSSEKNIHCNAPHLSRVALRKSGKKVCFRGLRESVMPG